MRKITDITGGMILVPVVSFTLAHGPVRAHANEYFLPHPDHIEERPSSGAERFVGKASLVIVTSSGSTILWPNPIPRT